MSVVSHTLYTLLTAITLTKHISAYGLSELIHYGRYNNAVFFNTVQVSIAS